MKGFDSPIYVTRPFLPSLSEFSEGLKEIWDNLWLTNNGPIVQRFEKRLETFFQNQNVCLFNNGTLALQIALQGLGVSGEVITTPFTFVATTHALYWNKIRPVFCDIEPVYYSLDPDKIEELITPWTTAILAVHVFGFPCDLERLSKIAKKHNLILIYDAAHAFGVEVSGKPISNFGDLSMFSFHATKLFHSFEGGALTFKDNGLKEKFNYLKNFGFKNELEVVMPGTNAKMNEVQALMGVQMLSYLAMIIEKRKKIAELYRDRLSNIPGIIINKTFPKNITYNYAYMPIQIVKEQFGVSRDMVYTRFKDYNVFTRKYFYPLINDYACYQNIRVNPPLTKAEKVSSQILTLPIYESLSHDDVNHICDLLLSMRG